jgi:hypothetical protein
MTTKFRIKLTNTIPAEYLYLENYHFCKMFQKDKSLFLASSASPFTRNLSVTNKNRQQTRISIAHKNRFNLITLDTKSHVASDSKEISIETDKDMPLDKDTIMQVIMNFYQVLRLSLPPVPDLPGLSRFGDHCPGGRRDPHRDIERPGL